jgi:hypothetical protein
VHACQEYEAGANEKDALPVSERVLVLHRNELRPAILKTQESERTTKSKDGKADLVRDVVVVRKLPRPHRASADVANLARLDEVVQRLHRLLQPSSENVDHDRFLGETHFGIHVR